MFKSKLFQKIYKY